MAVAETDAEQSGSERLLKIGQQLRAGEVLRTVKTRELLRWFGQERRGVHVIRVIRESLSQAGLKTNPDFENTAYIDEQISFELVEQKTASNINVEASEKEQGSQAVFGALGPTRRLNYDSYRPQTEVCTVLSQIKNAVGEAITAMMDCDYSQVPVMTSERDVKGVVTWRNIPQRLALGELTLATEVREFMETALVVSSNESLFDVMDDIVKTGYVLVRNDRQQITGIVTASDINSFFKTLTEPFLFLSEIGKINFRRYLSTLEGILSLTS